MAMNFIKKLEYMVNKKTEPHIIASPYGRCNSKIHQQTATQTTDREKKKLLQVQQATY
jgi:hypothetical protein